MATPKPTGSSYTPPVQPDTSVGAFIQSHPEYSGDERFLYGSPQYVWQADRHAKINAAYDSWKAQLDNQYNADLETYKVGLNSYVNQADMLEAAGYNRNWLGGAPELAQSGMSPTPSDSPRQTGNPVNTPMQMLAFAGQSAGMALDLYGKLADVKLKSAQTQNVEAQAEYTRSMTPFKLVRSYFDSLPDYMKWYGTDLLNSGMGYFEPVAGSGKGITFQTPSPGSFGSSMLDLTKRFAELRNSGVELQNQYQALSNTEKEFVINAIQPMQVSLMRAQAALMRAQEKVAGKQLDILGFNKEIAAAEKRIREKEAEIIEKYGLKGAGQRYFSNWVNLGLNTVKTGVYTYGAIAGKGMTAGMAVPAFTDESSLYGFGTPTDW